MSTYTPLSRWFTNEKARENRELSELYRQVEARHAASPYAGEHAVVDFVLPVWKQINENVADETIAEAFGVAMCRVASLERYIFDLPTPTLDALTMKEAVGLGKLLRDKQYFYAHEDRITGLVSDGLKEVFGTLATWIPEAEAPSPFTVPMVHVIPLDVIDSVYAFLRQDRYIEANVFTKLFERLWFNLCEASGVVDPYEPRKQIIVPSKCGLPPETMVRDYFKGTPFFDLFMTQVPLRFSYEDRFGHMHVLGGSGAGKTQLLQHLILHDLDDPDPPTLIIVDSQTDLVAKISGLECFDPTGHKSLSERLILIDPRDISNPPALNVFDINRERLGSYSEVMKEQVAAGVIETFDYLFSGLFGADLTAKQDVFFKFVARLMLALPDTMGRNATILDILNLMENPEPFRKAIESLPPIQRAFFERDFLDPKKSTFKQTKEQITYRLNAILENPTLARLFTQPKTKLDLFTAINNRSVIVVDTAKDFLKSSSAHFGRIFISLVMQAILERAAIPERERVPAFLIIDEAAAYFDSNMDDLLTEARKYKLGCVFAHQFLGQASSALKASLAANTRIKMCSGVSNDDARTLASDMRTTADFILNQPPLAFATYIRGVTKSAVSVPIEAGRLESRPRMDARSYLMLRELNRDAVCLPTPPMALAAPSRDPETPQKVPPRPRPNTDWMNKPPKSPDVPDTDAKDW